MDEDIITLLDEETNEEVQLRIIDNFDMDDRSFGVFITLEENDDEVELVILEMIEEGEEVMFQSLDESEEDKVYDFYDSLLDEDELEEGSSEE
jgi:intein/homing endonuclease